MAKTLAVKEDGGVVATGAAPQVPGYLQTKQMTGAGVSSSKDDMLIPMATVLQTGSPQVKPRDPQQIIGAAAGDIFLKNAPQPVIQGDTGFLFQPCYFDKAIVEWKPRGGGGGGGAGFVARHEITADGAWPKALKDDSEERPDPQNAERKLIIRKSTGNVLVETRYHAGFIISEGNTHPPMPAVLPFASSGHTVSRGWTFLMNQKVFNGSIVDSWAVYYRVKTRLRTKGENSWYVFDVMDAGPSDESNNPTTMWAPGEQDYERGAALHTGIKSGEKQLAQDEASASPDVGGATSRAADHI